MCFLLVELNDLLPSQSAAGGSQFATGQELRVNSKVGASNGGVVDESK